MRLLITRPADDAEVLRRRLTGMGHACLLAPVLRIEPVPFAAPPGPHAGVVFTSRNAVRALGRSGVPRETLSLPVWCVGEATAREARTLGFTSVNAAGGDVHSLARSIAAAIGPSADPLLHPRGRDTREDLGTLLGPAGIDVDDRVIYEAVAEDVLPEPARSAFAAGTLDGVLLLSPRSAAILTGLVSAAGLEAAWRTVTAFCISDATARSLEPATGRTLIARTPTLEAVLDLLPAASTP